MRSFRSVSLPAICSAASTLRATLAELQFCTAPVTSSTLCIRSFRDRAVDDYINPELSSHVSLLFRKFGVLSPTVSKLMAKASKKASEYQRHQSRAHCSRWITFEYSEAKTEYMCPIASEVMQPSHPQFQDWKPNSQFQVSNKYWQQPVHHRQQNRDAMQDAFSPFDFRNLAFSCPFSFPIRSKGFNLLLSTLMPMNMPIPLHLQIS